MDLEEKSKRDRNGKGRQVQERELVGRDEAKAREERDGRKGIVRRATFDDLNAIMDINDNIYDGFDYMPTLFNIFMQSKLHVIYVYEEDGKLVSLLNFRFHPDRDDLVSGMSARVRPSHEGRGLGISVRSLVHDQLLEEYPALKRRVADSLYIPRVSAKMNKFRVNYHWVSLLNFRFHPDRDDLVSEMSARVRPSHEGRGLGISTRSLVHDQLLKEYPALKRRVGNSRYIPRVSAKMSEFQVNYHWNILVYYFADRYCLSRSARIRQNLMPFGARRPLILSYATGTEWLDRSDQLLQFLSKYVKDFFPCGNSWMAIPFNRSGLRHMLSNTNVYISMDMESTIIDKSSSVDPIHVHGTVCEQQGTRDRGQEGEVVGLSYSTGLSCKNGIRFDIFFYGDCEKVFASHVYSHLQHYNSITSDGARVRVSLHFPLSIDSKNAEAILKEEMGNESFQDGRPTQAVQYIEDLPQAKL